MTPLLFRPVRRVVLPLERREHQAFVARWHRHSDPAVGELFALGLYDRRGEPLGCVVVGRPVARLLDDGERVEVTRCCVRPRARGAIPSDLYLCALAEAHRRWGEIKVITYTLASEPGTSLVAAGFERESDVRVRRARPTGRPAFASPQATQGDARPRAVEHDGAPVARGRALDVAAGEAHHDVRRTLTS